MKLIDIILKELLVVKSQKVVLLLLLLYPILVVGLLGISFSGGMFLSNLGTINVGIVNNLNSDFNLIDSLKDRNDLKFVEYSDVNKLNDGVKHGEVLIGLLVYLPKKDAQIEVSIYTDNSSLFAGSFISDFVRVNVQNVIFNNVQNKLDSIFKSINGFTSNISSQIIQVREFKDKLDVTNKTLTDLERDINNLDFDEIESALNSQKNSVDNYKQKNNDFKTKLDSFKIKFELFKSQLNSIKIEFKKNESDLNLMIVSMGGVENELDVISLALSGTQYQDQLLQIKNKISSWKLTAQKLQDLSIELNSSESELNKTISETDKLFDDFDNESENISSALSDSSTTIESMNNKLNVFKGTVDNVKQLIIDSKQSKIEIESKLDNSEKLLISLNEQFAKFDNIDPSIFAHPVKFFKKNVFVIDTFGIIIANAISIVLILTCMLLTAIVIILEKNENITLRLELGKTSKFVLFFGKIIGQLLIALLISLIIIIIAQFIFNLNIFSILIQLIGAIILVSLLFISLGILISLFTKSQSTAILLCLLITVPMIFLSGIILPIEFMPSFMQTIAFFFPLTLANNILIGILVKGFMLTDVLFEVSLILLYSILIFILALVVKEKFN
ncbi:MAG: ABC transporter permease [Candidatus ainarchaeum sp.]|nr:ABC transporter permease [Candidatus ainarchaeum sp.]